MDTEIQPLYRGLPVRLQTWCVTNGWQFLKYNEDVGELHRTDASETASSYASPRCWRVNSLIRRQQAEVAGRLDRRPQRRSGKFEFRMEIVRAGEEVRRQQTPLPRALRRRRRASWVFGVICFHRGANIRPSSNRRTVLANGVADNCRSSELTAEGDFVAQLMLFTAVKLSRSKSRMFAATLCCSVDRHDAVKPYAFAPGIVLRRLLAVEMAHGTYGLTINGGLCTPLADIGWWLITPVNRISAERRR